MHAGMTDQRIPEWPDLVVMNIIQNHKRLGHSQPI